MTRDVNQSILNMSGDERKTFGLIVSFEGENGSRLTLHEAGSALIVLGSMCAEALRRDPTLRVVAISSPSSIWTDLTGRKMAGRSGYQAEQTPSAPEASMLRRAGFPGMLHERLRGRGLAADRLWGLVDKDWENQ